MIPVAPGAPMEVPIHAETLKLTDKIEAFLPTNDRGETPRLLRRYVAQIALRSPVVGAIRDYG